MKKNLTNEEIKSYFSNNFELASYAIEIAREHIHKEMGNSLSDILKTIRERAEKLPKERPSDQK